jgi:AAA+ superfamily predicted ATPase
MVSGSKTKVENPGQSISGVSYSGLLPALRRLDQVLERAIHAAPAVYGQEAASDPFRGLHINGDEVSRLLNREPGAPTLWAGEEEVDALTGGVMPENARLAWLREAFGLSLFDIDVLLIALASELDLRYERLFAYLQDDVTKKRPSVDLVLNILCPSAEAKLARRAHFAREAPLFLHRLLHLIPDPQQTQPSLLAHYLKVDEQIVRLLLEQGGLDPRLAPFCQMSEPVVSFAKLLVSAELKQALPALARQAQSRQQPLRLHFCGPCEVSKRRVVEALAAELEARLLAVDLAHLLASTTDVAQTFYLVFREAWFQDAILYLDNVDVLCSDERSSQRQHLLDALQEHVGITILAGARSWTPVGRNPLGVLTIPFSIPGFAERQACWRTNLATEGITLTDQEVDVLADRFRLLPDQIAEAVATTCHQVRWRRAAQSPAESGATRFEFPTLSDFLASARAQSNQDLAAFAYKITPQYTWTDIVLPADAVTQLREMCQRVAQRHRVLGEWGFGRKLSLGKGANALFAGPSGTGKTMAAEIIANELGLDLYRIDLSGVVSKYIGETEKNLDRIFTTAENANAILFFDEADALFGKRSEVRDSHDRYANIEISYLLQKMEQYEGVTILATNLRQNLDESFVRRLAFTVNFPFPDEADRRRIWGGIWPPETPMAVELDLDLLAHQFKLSGGNIKNIALAAAFLAAEDGGAVTMTHVIQATRREYQKLGKQLGAAELGVFALEAAA